MPLFFRSAGRPLFAVHHLPAVARPDAPVLVHCHGLGAEQMVSYRTEVLAARAAAARGWPVLRFHARGHGDSAGDAATATLDDLVDDALAAADEARRRSGAARVVWLGVRFGALVAAKALARRRDTAGLVLWEPVLQPADYFHGMLRGLLFSQLASGRRPTRTVDELLASVVRDGPVDVNGYELHAPMLESSRGVELPALLAAHAAPTLVAQLQRRPKLADGPGRLVAALEAQGCAVAVRRYEEEPGWHFLRNPAWQSPALAHDTAGWLDALA